MRDGLMRRGTIPRKNGITGIFLLTGIFLILGYFKGIRKDKWSI
jgi:hypothetical protein